MTLVVYDVDNIKTSNRDKTKTSSKFDIVKLKQYIESVIDDTYFNHTAFYGLSTPNSFRFKTMLEHNGFDVVVKRGKFKECDYKGMTYTYTDVDIDGKLVSNTIKASKLFDNIVVVSGDGDFFPMMVDLDREGKYVVAVGWKDNTSSRIKNKFDFIELDELAKKKLI